MAEPAEGLFYFAEQVTDNDKISYNVQHGPGNDWWLEFDTCLHVFEFMNRNTRQYLGDNIMEALAMEKIQSQLKANDWFGEMDHPYPAIDGQKLSTKRIRTIELSRRSHNIRNPRREGNKLYAHILTAGNDVGKGFANEIIRGMVPQFSCRCLGVMKLVHGKPTIVVNLVVTYDWVLYPGFDEAHMVGGPTTKTGSIAVTESADGGSHDIAIPIAELALDVSEKDGGVAAFMESMDMDASNIIGFSGDKAVLSPDRDHYIYAKMNPTTVERVRDFYRSFGK
jgi:hypothetical protein